MPSYSESKLCEDFLRKSSCRLCVDLHPSKLASVQEGVREYLNSLLLRFNEDLGGVVMSYQNEKVLSQAALVHPYFPFTRVVVTAEFVLFSPRPGAKLVGVANKIADSYIGLLVLGFMNVSIRSAHIRPDIQPALGEGYWASKKAPTHRIETGSTVVFTIETLERHGTFLTLSGSLVDENTGNIEYVKPTAKMKSKPDKASQANEQDAAIKQKKQKKSKEPNGSSKAVVVVDVHDDDENTVGVGEEPSKSKKSKKKKETEVDVQEKRKKEKKKKRDAEEPSSGIKKTKKAKAAG